MAFFGQKTEVSRLNLPLNRGRLVPGKMQNLGLLLKHARKIQGLTQQELGDQIGATRQTIARWEDNDIPDCASPTVCAIVGEALTTTSDMARQWRIDHDLLEHRHKLMRVQIASIVSDGADR
jgi:DNA-binding XRE family transcriptional regulator